MKTRPTTRRIRRSPGSALVLTLFTIAALLTLGTTFIVLATNESHMSQGEKDTQMARQLASYGVSWAVSWMAHPMHWGAMQADVTDGTFNYPLQDKAPDIWMNKAYTFTTVSTGKWQLAMTDPIPLGGGSDLNGYITVTITGILPGPAQPPQYTVQSVAMLAHGSDSNNPIAGRTITARMRPESALDFAIFESNMKTWDTPGLDTQYQPTGPLANQPQYMRPDGTVTFTPPPSTNPVTPGWQVLGTPADQYNALLQQTKDPIGINTNTQFNGDIRVDGSNNGNYLDNYSGDLKFFTDSQAGLSTIKFNGNHTSIETGKNDEYGTVQADGSYKVDNSVTDQNSGVFTGGPLAHDGTKGLPTTAGYLDTINPDGSLNSGSAALVAGRGQPDATNANGQYYGYIKTGTPPGGPVGVNPSSPPAEGADVEYDSTGQNQQPGFAKTEITLTSMTDPNTGQTVAAVDIKKVGAYSGKEVPDSNPIVNQGPIPVSKINDGVLYVDGGNVQVNSATDAQGNPVAFNSQLSIIAGASTDRPTVYSNGGLVSGTVGSNDIYLPASNPIFQPDSKGMPTHIPAQDANGRTYWPAYDPSLSPTADAPVQREGNLTVTGDVKKGTGELGLLAQNNILLSDQNANKPQNGATMEVDAVMMSLQHSVQYGGFLSEGSNYWKNLAGPDIPRPIKDFHNSTIQVTGSIIGAFSDVEGAIGGIGYQTQQFTHDDTLKNSLPPMFPQFDRSKGTAQLKFVVLNWDDSSAIKDGSSTPSTLSSRALQ